MGLALPNRTIVSLVLLFGSILSAQAQLAVPPCKAINALPAIINATGIWCLQKDLTWAGTTGNAIDVQAAAVTLDLNGFTITGSLSNSTQAIGIHSLNRRNVTMRNGTIRGFRIGISLEGASAINNVIQDMHIDQQRLTGIDVQQTVRTAIRNNQVTNIGAVTIDGVVGINIFQAKFAMVTNNTVNGVAASSADTGIAASHTEMAEIRDNTVLNVVAPSSVGIVNNGSSYNSVINNRVLNSVTLGTTGISGGGGVNCINNVIQRYTTASTCNFDSGNVTPPN